MMSCFFTPSQLITRHFKRKTCVTTHLSSLSENWIFLLAIGWVVEPRIAPAVEHICCSFLRGGVTRNASPWDRRTGAKKQQSRSSLIIVGKKVLLASCVKSQHVSVWHGEFDERDCRTGDVRLWAQNVDAGAGSRQVHAASTHRPTDSRQAKPTPARLPGIPRK